MCNILIKLYKQIHLFEICSPLLFYDIGNIISFSQQKPIKFETQKYHLQTSVFLVKLQKFRLKFDSYKILRKTFQINCNILYHDLDYKIFRKTFQINCNILDHDLNERCCVHN